MACNNLEGIMKGCETSNSGGIYAVYINDTSNVTGTTVNTTAHTITNIGTTSDFATFQFNRNVGSMVADTKVDLIQGSTYWETTVTLSFARREGSKSRALQILGEGQRFLELIIQDANGLYWYVDHAQLSGGAEETGTAKADGSKYNVTFKADMNNRPYQVDASIIAALIS